MNAAVTDAEPDDALLELVRANRVTGVVDEVTVKEPVLLAPRGEARYSVALLDYGYKRSIADCLTARGCAVTRLPRQDPGGADTRRRARRRDALQRPRRPARRTLSA